MGAPIAAPAPYREGAAVSARKATIPRVVVVSRPTEYDELLRRHGTRAQAAFFLGERRAMLDEIEARHAAQDDALAKVTGGLPTKWRRSRVPRAELSRFVFEPGDVVAAIGQDGLVANVAKYLDGQAVVGVDPLPGRNAGALVRFDVSSAADALRLAVEGRVRLESRLVVGLHVGLFGRDEVVLHVLQEVVVHGLHAQVAAGLHDALELHRLALADEVRHGGCR
jgi:NAD kinase